MQPECYQATQNTEPENPPSRSQTFTQHGKHHCDESVPGHILPEDGGDRERLAGSPLSPSDLLDVGRVNGTEEGVNSGGRTQSKPPVDRISEYESAALGSPKRPEEFGFKVIPSRNHTTSGVSIEHFPNEVMTHILSHLPPISLSSMSLVSHHFHSLVTTPHAWRIAFSRYFLGPAALAGAGEGEGSEDWEHILLKRRAFCRLIALTSWRSEYIIRTRLLRSLSRGKPVDYQPPGQQNSSRNGATPPAHSVVTYNSLLLYPATHIDGVFGSGSKKLPMFAHGASEQGIATLSEPTSGRTGIGGWGVSDPQMFNNFSDLFPGETQWGMGPGDFVGVPNVMDVSQLYGTVYGEGCPQGRTYFLSSSEKRGRFLFDSGPNPQAQLGIPVVHSITTGVCSVWIAKSPEVLKMTGGLFGMLSGSSSGILTAYALGPNPSYDQRFERGQVTARWVLSPGVPIIEIKVDEKYSAKRHAQRRIWATVLNALGEVFYLDDLPRIGEANPKISTEELGKLAWETGRSVRWELIEDTRRTSQPDPFNNLLVDGSYSPRSSSNSMGLNQNQIAAETKEIEKYLAFKPKHFRKVCLGWNMKRNLEVDFAGDDNHGAGESIMIIDRGSGEGQNPAIRRFTRLKPNETQPRADHESFPQLEAATAKLSIFGGSPTEETEHSVNIPSTPVPSNCNGTQRLSTKIGWRRSDLVLDEPKNAYITTSAMDGSTFAGLTMFEDPLFGMCGSSSASSRSSSPSSVASMPSLPTDIPGQRARFMAIGTSLGSVICWDIRAAVSQNDGISNKIFPLRIIHTDSPQISSLALTSLYLVHGGNDGLVQAWDPLGSSMQPIRTLNSRFSSRARRRLMQAEASRQGVGQNYFAAGAICLDPDPTRLRGAVALGTQLRYWAYSSSAADQYKSSKRRIRYGHRGSNSSAENQRFSHTGRGSMQDYIMNEKIEVERQKKAQEKKNALLSGRFGVDLLGTDTNEEDLLAYACMLSEEVYTSDEKNLPGNENTVSASASSSSDTVAPNDIAASSHKPEPEPSDLPLDAVDEELDPDIAEAIRRSLHEEEEPATAHAAFVVNNVSPNKYGSNNPSADIAIVESSIRQEVDDLDFAIQLSLAEKRSETETTFSEPDEFPALGNAPNTPSRNVKGKGRA